MQARAYWHAGQKAREVMVKICKRAPAQDHQSHLPLEFSDPFCPLRWLFPSFVQEVEGGPCSLIMDFKALVITEIISKWTCQRSACLISWTNVVNCLKTLWVIIRLWLVKILKVDLIDSQSHSFHHSYQHWLLLWFMIQRSFRTSNFTLNQINVLTKYLSWSF